MKGQYDGNMAAASRFDSVFGDHIFLIKSPSIAEHKMCRVSAADAADMVSSMAKSEHAKS